MAVLNYVRQWRSLAKEALDRTAIVAKFLCFLHVTNTYLCSSTLVYGPSMLPTLNITGDVVLAEHVSHRFGKVGPGDLVLVRSPDDPRKTVTKRIVGVEGDKVTFLVPMSTHQYRTAVVPKGHVWIQGDNTYVSNDSRNFGPVPYGLIQGKVFFRVWPPDSIGFLGQ
ncbi:mitochondrial ATP-independent inner membrane protease subunit 1a [Ziziphus jujuba]|uniref:Mitochondrial ATP-independent inner membrane protease subunit 1a n=1 Tax=Ziziphus jujuba TaxID=326968 RepID=A0A6P3ZR90_ZIZJJ|nr:mitochondrial ATP-independent inner membrane protease subunit 1a [Ziziphus jujuba]